MLKQIAALIFFVGVSFGAPAVSAFFSITSGGDWYRELNKPWFNPPAWIFGPVWTLLYLLMGIAGWLVWRQGSGWPLQRAMGLFALQWVLNAAWTPLFFGMHRPGLALLDLVALWCAIVGSIAAFLPISRAASLLFAPYVLWVSFATILNATLWWLNRV